MVRWCTRRSRWCRSGSLRYEMTESTGSHHNGGVPPFGHSTQLRVFVDPDLLQYDIVWAAAGTWNDNFGAAPADIVRVAGGVVTDLKWV
ncbi:MAG: YbaK/EbsC family protein [Ilumatobacteraceae bacterium]